MISKTHLKDTSARDPCYLSEPNSEKHWPYIITSSGNHTGHENKGNDHHRQYDLIFNEILPLGSVRNR